MELKATINAKRALEALRVFPELLGKNVRLATKASLRDIRVGAQQDHAFISRSNNAERSVAAEVNESGVGGRVFLDTGIAAYAPFLHEGTGKYGPKHAPYPIRPTNKKTLRFVKGGRFIYARGVMHPGIKGDPFLFRSADREQENVGKRFDKAVDASIKQGGLQ